MKRKSKIKYTPLTDNQLCYFCERLNKPSTSNDIEEIESRIADCVYDISCYIADFFWEKRPASIWFPGAEEGELGHPNLNADDIEFVYGGFGRRLNSPIPNWYSVATAFPKRWLCMTLDQIENDIYNYSFIERDL